jgi:hypothetical protein
VALAAGNLVYLAAGAGLLDAEPLFGVVDFVGGTSPDVVRVNWENGAQNTFSSEVTSGLVEIANDPDQSPVGDIARVSFSGSLMSGQIMRTFFSDPDGANIRSAVLRSPNGNFWMIATFADME